MQAEIKTVTPEYAAELLARRNEHNRAIRPAIVNEYLSWMKEDVFKLTHQGIAIDWNGNLVDGQHRLTAILKLGKAIDLLVISDVDPEIFRVIDRGANRTIPEVTGESRYTVEVCRFIFSEFYGTVRQSSHTLKPVIAAFRDASEALRLHCPSRPKKRGSAPIRAAAVLCMMDRDRQVAMDAYRRCILQDYSKMRPIEMSLSKWLVDTTLTTAMRSIAFCSALIAFDAGHKATSVRLREPGWHKANAKVRIGAIMGANKPATTSAKIKNSDLTSHYRPEHSAETVPASLSPRDL